MLTKEYNEKEIAEMFFEDGLEQGIEQGEDRLAGLCNALIAEGRSDDALRVMQDSAYRKKMLAEYEMR